MAKLTNVKYPNEVVEIEGVQYRKVDREAKAGDIVKVLINDYVDVEKGAFYSVITEDGATGFFDDGGDFREGDIEKYPEDFEVYEKVSEPATPEYREVKREAKVGERIRIVAATLAFGTYENGDEFTVTSTHGSVGVRIDRKWRTSPVKDAWVRHDEYVVLEPVNYGEPAPQPNRRLTVGDYAKVVDASGCALAKVGDIITVTQTGELICGNTFDGRYISMFDQRFVRATESEVEAAKKAAERAKQIGEFADGGYAVVKSDADGYFSGGYRGSYVKVRPTSVPGPYALEVALPEQLGYNGYCNADALRKVTREEYEAATEPRLKVGDLARTLVGKDVPKGAIVRITRDDRSALPYRGELLDGSEYDWYAPEQLEKVSAEEAKWSAIGRKVNEFKAGDVVQVTQHVGVLPKGTVGEVGEICGTQFRVNALGRSAANWHTANSAKLIVPVEQRFDLAEGGADLSK